MIVLIGVLTAVNMVSAAFFLWIGAGPIPIFLFLDVAAVIFAFTLSNRAARRRERVQVTASEVRVVRESPRGARTVWVSPTALTRVKLMEEGAGELRLHVWDRTLRLAEALSRPERADFARALDLAIWKARMSPRAA